MKDMQWGSKKEQDKKKAIFTREKGNRCGRTGTVTERRKDESETWEWHRNYRDELEC